ncbi:hypothetical protein Pla22_27600 [Rubripirellula amarantea]|uniref:Uncharacterized protein n=2 Tax=Rubripirellula amarantea TaxID=2527999 RepID=A0A5C5WWM2_9BACT|nr:hypothetical protein Pla22_27600 [Rubripirellula amarantea]
MLDQIARSQGIASMDAGIIRIDKSKVSVAWPYRRIFLHAMSIGGLIVAALVVWDQATGGDSTSLVRENGLLENAQIVLLGATTLVGLACLMRIPSRLGKDAGFWRYVTFAIVCVAMLGCVREIQSIGPGDGFDGFGLPRFVKRIISGSTALALVVMTVVGAYRTRGQWLSFTRFANLGFLWPLLPFVGLFVGAEVSEELNWGFAEESVEVIAYSMMLVTTGWLLTTDQLSEESMRSEADVDGVAYDDDSDRDQRIAA